MTTDLAPPAVTTIRPGWNGRYFEDMKVGDIYEHQLGRTVLATDNSWFTLLTQNTAPLHFDRYYASQTSWGKPLVDSTFTLALVTGQSVSDVSQHVFANLAWDHVEMPHPVFEGDTLHATTEVAGKRPSKSRPGAGIVELIHRCYNHDDKLVAECHRSAFIRMRPGG